MTELEVPRAALEEIAWQRGYSLPDLELESGAIDLLNIRVRQIAAPVVAAELRALAGDMHQPWDAAVLRRRADLIEGGFS